jgi:hypothetical protein
LFRIRERRKKNTMTKVWGRGLLAVGLLAVIVLVLLHKGEPPSPSRRLDSASPVASAPEAPSQRPLSNVLAVARNFGVRKAILTAEERADLERKFTAKIKPAVEKWCKAYGSHVPFKPEDLTLDKFKEQIGRNAAFTIYTFMLDGITLCVRDSNGRVVVNYLNTPQSKQLSQLPSGTAPTLALPVSRNDIIRIVKADSGTEFKPNEVQIRPTGLASAMNGGAFVDIAPLWGNPNNGLSKVSLVFGPNGDLVYYDRDPTF